MASRPRSRRLLLAAVLVLLLVPPIAYWQLRDWQQVRVARQAYAALSVCLYGGPPPSGEQAARALRNGAIASSLDTAHADWPRRCAAFALRLEQSVRALRAQRMERLEKDGASSGCGSDDRCAELLAFLGQLGQLRPFLRTAELGPFEPAELHRLALRLRLDGGLAAAVTPPPRAPQLLSPGQMDPLYRGNYLRLLTDPAGNDLLQLLFYEQRAQYGLCAVDLRADAPARCRLLPGGIPVELAGELLAAEPAAPLVLYAQGFVGDRWTEGLYDAETGAELERVPTRPAGGMVWRDGTITRLDRHSTGDRVELVRRLPDGAVESVVAPVAAEVSAGPRLVWHHVVWTVDAGEGRHRLFAQPVLRAGALHGPIHELGTTEPLAGKPEFDMCRTADALVLLVTGTREDRALRGSLVFRTSDRWQPPVGLRIGSGRYGFTCQDSRATLSWITGVDEQYAGEHADPRRLAEAPETLPVRGRYQVSRLRCTAERCERHRAAIELERHSRDSRYVAGDLGDSMVVLWRSKLGDVRMRLAPLEELPSAPDVPLFDDLEHGGFGWDLERDPIFGRSGAVLVLVSAQVAELEESWTFGIRLDAAGQATAVEVATGAAADSPQLKAPRRDGG
ncbi:MAG: hypothetical protein JRI23_27795 [Deltaproteobacteria bacterium]|jgi:hypothetical protein|nr:hypothetical protein [Deltaproteobacteria bacterium]MBW2535892.1 hypothetical protein [Deltaproteobacteria bacterium]